MNLNNHVRARGSCLHPPDPRSHSARRWGRPDQLAGAVVFLAPPASGYLHGHVLAVDAAGWATADVPVAEDCWKTRTPLYACHEHNYGMVNALSGARANEKESLAEAARELNIRRP
jgi:hypothetical protein